MLMDTLNGQTGDQVTLFSPIMTFDEHSALMFSYYMYLNDTDTTGTLTVYRYTQLHTYDKVLFSTRGSRLDRWQSEMVCIPTGKYRLAFVGIVGLPSLSDIAVDNIEVFGNAGECDYSNSSTSTGIVIWITTTTTTTIIIIISLIKGRPAPNVLDMSTGRVGLQRV